MSKVKALDKQVSAVDNLVAEPNFLSLLVSSKGGGKSTLILHLLLHEYKNKFNRLIYISPTSSLDEKCNVLKVTKMLVPNMSLINAINKDLIEEYIKKPYRGEPKLLTKDVYNEYPDEFHKDISKGMIQEIINEQEQICQKYDKELCDKILIVLDDSICNDLIKTRFFVNFLLLSRHYNVSMIIASQAYRLLVKSLRLNCDNLYVFAMSNTREMRDVFDEWFCNKDSKDVIQIYKNIIKTPYAFLQINRLNPTRKLIEGVHKFVD